MKKIYLVLSTFLLLACIDTDSNKPYSEFEEIITEVEDNSVIKLNGTISVPENSTINTDNLTVTTFNEDSNVVGSKFSVNVSRDQHTNIFVTNKNGTVTFMGYVYPSQTNYKIDASSTVLAMLMNLPMTTMLSTEAKTNFIEDIKMHQNFSKLVNSMEALIINEKSPLSTDEEGFMIELLSFFESATQNKRSNEPQDPVQVNWAAPGKDVNFVNPGKPYAVKIGVYKNDERVDELSLEGVNILATSIGDALTMILNLNNGNIDVEEVTYNMVDDGYYDFKIRNGWGKDDTEENKRARFKNGAKITVAYVKAMLSMNTQCVSILHDYLEYQYELDTSFEGKLDTPNKIIGHGIDHFYNLMNFSANSLPNCLGISPNSILLLSLKQFFKYLTFAFNINTLANGNLIAIGLSKDNGALDVCYEVIDGKAQKCNKVKISGDIDFGEVVAGEEAEQVLTISNDYNETINYVLSGLDSSFGVGQSDLSGTIEANQEKEILIYFNPEEIKEYEISPSIGISKEDVDDIEFNITGKGIQKKLDIELVEGNLDFGSVSLTSEEIRTIKLINNNETVPITVESISEPEDFSVDYSGGIFVAAGEEELIRVIFKPSEVKDYSTDLKITSDADPYNHTLAITADGIEAVMEVKGDLSFGKQDINTETFKSFEIINHSSTESIEISGIRMDIEPEVAFFITNNWNSSIPPNSRQEVQVVFIPSKAEIYAGNVIVENNFQSIPNSSLPIRGEGVDENNNIDLSGEWIPTWEVAQCDILGTYCCGCTFHENARNFIFIGENQCSSSQICGEMDWANQQIGSSDTPTINSWTLEGDTLTIELRSGQTSGFQFTDRTLTWTGTYDPDTDLFTGAYEANFYGGLIISAEATGTLTLTRIAD